jgi:membrane-bound lytic murein transglycosylase D
MMKKSRNRVIISFLVYIGFYASVHSIFAVNKFPTKYSDTSFVFKQDDPISAMLDSLNYLKLWEVNATPANLDKLNIYHYRPDEVPVFDDMVYSARMAKLDAASPINLDYHPSVRPYIEMYLMRKRSTVSRMLGLSKLYFPIFEEQLDKFGLPLELKNLAIIESALNANATSRAGAAGLWQFMYGTGKMFGLDITSYVDERRDPYKATEAACKYFKFLYKMFGDWQLVLAAYNGGPGTVNKAIRRSGGKKTYWEIRPYLPLETQGYVPAFIAANYVMNYTAEHNLYPTMPRHEFFQVDTVKATQQVSFYQLSEVLGVTMEDLASLNPSYKKHVVPFNENGSTIVLPYDKVGAFVNNEQAIYAYRTPEEKQRELEAELAKSITYKEIGKIHKVKRGETLAAVARKYGVSSSEVKEWNRLKSGKLKTGQRITVYVKIPVQNNTLAKETKTTSADSTIAENIDKCITASDSSSASNCCPPEQQASEKKENTQKKINNTEKKTKTIYYTVQRGDTLWRIANKYQGVTVEDLKRINGLRNGSSLKAGTKIKVSVRG